MPARTRFLNSNIGDPLPEQTPQDREASEENSQTTFTEKKAEESGAEAIKNTDAEMGENAENRSIDEITDGTSDAEESEKEPNLNTDGNSDETAKDTTEG